MRVLCVDLDGTLIHTDSLHEKILLLFKKNPLSLFLILWWWLRGKAFLKHRLSQLITLPVELLPYNHQLLAWLKKEKAKGRKLVLVTAADKAVAEAVAHHLGIFNEVLASNGRQNLKSKYKAEALNARYGRKNYDYVGDAKADLKVWQNAQEAHVVSKSKRFIKRINKHLHLQQCFLSSSLSLKGFLKAIRVHQYAKNVLVFVPFITAHLIFNEALFLQMLKGFICFCCVASSVYLLNDLLDLMSDRQHPNKSKRAIASGLLSIKDAIVLIFFFLGLAGTLAWNMPLPFIAALSLYYGLTLLYSLFLKQQLLIDVITLSALYTIRIVAGMVLITSNTYSLWLLLFSMFIFLSLAFLKRVSELILLQVSNKTAIVGRAYQVAHCNLLTTFGVASGFLAMLILALYLNSSTAEALYRQPYLLLLLFPILVYWLCRIWMLAIEGKVACDPVLFAVSDKTSYVCGILALSIMGMAFL